MPETQPAIIPKLEPVKTDLHSRVATVKQQYSAEQIEAMKPEEFAAATDLGEICEDGLQAKLVSSLRAEVQRQSEEVAIAALVATAQETFPEAVVATERVAKRVILTISKEL